MQKCKEMNMFLILIFFFFKEKAELFFNNEVLVPQNSKRMYY